MRVKDKTALLLKGVSMKDIKDLEEQEKLEQEQDEQDAGSDQEENQEESEGKPEEESTDHTAELIEQLTETVAAAVVEKLQLDNINRDHETNATSRTPEEVAKSIFKINRKKEEK